MHVCARPCRRAMGMTGDAAFARRGRLANASASGLPGPPPLPGGMEPPSSSGSGAGHEPGDASYNGVQGTRGMSLAQKMLEKMGWKEGEGLGRNRQGIAAPLVAQKVGKNAGVVTQADLRSFADTPAGSLGGLDGPDAKRPRVGGATLVGKPSRVLVMRNMVGPGEVDEALEEEVGHCSKARAVALRCGRGYKHAYCLKRTRTPSLWQGKGPQHACPHLDVSGSCMHACMRQGLRE